jgi:hypothetical protein
VIIFHDVAFLLRSKLYFCSLNIYRTEAKQKLNVFFQTEIATMVEAGDSHWQELQQAEITTP